MAIALCSIEDAMAQHANKGISIVIPAYNESQRIVPTLRKVHSFLLERGMPFEIIVVDDGSTDSTSEKVNAEISLLPNLKLIRSISNQGKGAAVYKGVMASQHELILLSDADLSGPIENLNRLLREIRAGYDIAIGSRALPESVIPVQQSLHRRTMGRIFNLIVRAMVLDGFRDTQCGFKLFRAKVAKSVFGRVTTPGFAFDVEVLLIARKMGYAIKETPIEWSNSPNSRVRLVSDSLAMFWMLLRIRRAHAKLQPEELPVAPLDTPPHHVIS
jgi:dolichyl-phosphate beta-glucosyltransferase